MDGLELIVQYRHADERVEIVVGICETFPVGEQLPRRPVRLRAAYRSTSPVKVFLRSVPGVFLRSMSTPLMRLQTSIAVRAVSGRLFQGFISAEERRSVAHGLLGRRIAPVFGLARLAKQRVVRRDDILDFRAVLGFEQRDGVDEDRLIGNEFAGPPQARQPPYAQRCSASAPPSSPPSVGGGSSWKVLYGRLELGDICLKILHVLEHMRSIMCTP